jgi:hypothetical protein
MFTKLSTKLQKNHFKSEKERRRFNKLATEGRKIDSLYAMRLSMANEFRTFIERAAQFYFDAFYCLKLKKFPICSLYAKWILCYNCSVEDKNYSSFKSIIIK